VVDWRLRTVELGIRLTGAKRRLSSAEATRADIERRVLRPAPFAPSRRIVSRSRLAVSRVGGAPVYVLSVSDPERDHPSVLYLHGGGYTAEMSAFHWRLVRQIAERCDAEVTVPIYPLAPTAVAETTVPLVGRILDDLCRRVGADSVVVMGDSAGGGLALASAQRRLSAEQAPPSGLILISPWLDATLADSRVAATEPRDAMLGRAGLSESARLYAGDRAVEDPMVSPLFGPVEGLRDIDVFTGTADLLNPDAHRLAEGCARAGVSCRIHEAPHMPHLYPLLPLLREAATARREIFSLIRAEPAGSPPPDG
jgi:epsilon-lactone hydrolase